LKYRQLGASELQVPVISLGSWLTYSGGVEKRQSLACVHKALDLGINFFDTANVYGRGAAESVLGEALAGITRHSYSLATKVFFPMSDTDRGLSRAQTVKQLDASLKRLRKCLASCVSCRVSRNIRCSGPPRKKDFPALRRTRHRPDRLVAARPGGVDRQIQTGRAASGRIPGRPRINGRHAAKTVVAGPPVDGRATGKASG
jgi:hypothetical protein